MARTLSWIVIVLTVGLGACGGRPQVPTVSPRSTQVTGVVTNGLNISMELLIHNPNTYDLDVYAIQARVNAQGHDLGSVEHATTVRLTSGEWTPFSTQIVVPWGDLPSLALTTMMTPTIPYHVEGRVMVRGPAGYTVRVPYELDGTIPRDMLLRVPGIPSIPGIPGISF
jgi:LEA14-like dessication related protein